jgi:hypothetical protein
MTLLVFKSQPGFHYISELLHLIYHFLFQIILKTKSCSLSIIILSYFDLFNHILKKNYFCLFITDRYFRWKSIDLNHFKSSNHWSIYQTTIQNFINSTVNHFNLSPIWKIIVPSKSYIILGMVILFVWLFNYFDFHFVK